MYMNKHAWANKDGIYKEVYYYICDSGVKRFSRQWGGGDRPQKKKKVKSKKKKQKAKKKKKNVKK